MSAHNPLSLIRQRAISRQWGRLYALHCHGIIAAPPGIREFEILVERRYATAKWPRPSRGLLHYRITPRGRELAFALF